MRISIVPSATIPPNYISVSTSSSNNQHTPTYLEVIWQVVALTARLLWKLRSSLIRWGRLGVGLVLERVTLRGALIPSVGCHVSRFGGLAREVLRIRDDVERCGDEKETGTLMGARLPCDVASRGHYQVTISQTKEFMQVIMCISSIDGSS